MKNLLILFMSILLVSCGKENLLDIDQNPIDSASMTKSDTDECPTENQVYENLVLIDLLFSQIFDEDLETIEAKLEILKSTDFNNTEESDMAALDIFNVSKSSYLSVKDISDEELEYMLENFEEFWEAYGQSIEVNNCLIANYKPSSDGIYHIGDPCSLGNTLWLVAKGVARMFTVFGMVGQIDDMIEYGENCG